MKYMKNKRKQTKTPPKNEIKKKKKKTKTPPKNEI
jgi:hypothetical protein